ncbi:MAG: Fic family protein [Candidatus Marinimicrobia bacterium]|nr:Fic family protein [Candidatus Neomarinimicrobiota bacterium]
MKKGIASHEATKARRPWVPVYGITPKAAKDLMRIEAIRTEIAHIPLPPPVEAELRRQARVRSTHFSTRIEGNRLTLDEAERVIRDDRAVFQGRERDVSEVRNYWNARLRVEEWAEKGRPVTEDLIRRLHALVEKGPRARATPYRDGQNAIRDAASGALVYLPPEAKDVPELMSGLAAWIESALRLDVPAPMVAGLAHYQFVTIHPYYDGNGRTARLLATFILHRSGYGLNGFLSVEEFHARDLAGYYAALAVHPHHNYYMGRAEADLSGWTEYFTGILTQTYEAVAVEARRLVDAGIQTEPVFLRSLDRRARTALALFAKTERIGARDIAEALALSERMARVLLKEWVETGWIEVADPSRKARAYILSAQYRQYMDGLSATIGG